MNEVAIADEIGKAGAGVVVSTAPHEIAAGIEKILRNERRISEMSLAARALASRAFSMDAMGARLEGLYQDILALNQGRRTTYA